MIPFLRTHRKLLFFLWGILLILTAALVSSYFFLIQSPFTRLPDGLSLPVSDGTLTLREPYQNEYSAVDYGPYNGAFHPESHYARLKVTQVRLLQTNTNSDDDQPYLIVEAIPETVFHCSSLEEFPCEPVIRLCIAYFPDDNSIVSMSPKIEEGRSYYMQFSSLSSREDPPSKPLRILEGFAEYSASSVIYSTIPVTDEGTVVVSKALLAQHKYPNTHSFNRTSYQLNDSVSVEAFEEIYRELIDRYCASPSQ